jgi:NAD(P)-dependent dehydrogenase (short-subunit alcohol dehydrogenase family)
VTGGSGGIGRAVCRRFAGEGAKVVVVDVDAERVAATITQLQEQSGVHQPLGLTLDVSQPDDMQETARLTLAQFQGVTCS